MHTHVPCYILLFFLFPLFSLIKADYPKSFLDRIYLMDLLIQGIASVEALKCRLDISLLDDRTWVRTSNTMFELNYFIFA